MAQRVPPIRGKEEPSFATPKNFMLKQHIDIIAKITALNIFKFLSLINQTS